MTNKKQQQLNDEKTVIDGIFQVLKFAQDHGLDCKQILTTTMATIARHESEPDKWIDKFGHETKQKLIAFKRQLN